jgi:ATP diphosphatase
MNKALSTPRYSIADLLRVMERLRDPKHGCPWDLKQDFKSIVPSTLEECYELASAIEQEDYHHVGEELGDVMFQVVFSAGEIEGVANGSVSVDDVNASWEAIKQQERSAREQHGVLADVPVALPALPRAQKLQKRAAAVGFDWHEIGSVMQKLEEELEELRTAIGNDNAAAVREEMGDVLFSCVNLSRHLKLDAEATLRESSSKFEQRFRAMELMAAKAETPLHELDETALDSLWERAKAL